MVPRPDYINQLLAFKDKKLAKILSGVRRSGKSTVLTLYVEHLRKNGIQKNQIQEINLEDVDNEHLLDYKVLYSHIKKQLIPEKKNYIFLDEVQNVRNFQKTARSLLDRKNVDLYMTGSNSKMLSVEWATSLSGRYVEIHVLPLSFKEYVCCMNDYGNNKTAVSSGLQQIAGLQALYNQYIEFGSFPQAVVDFIKSAALTRTAIQQFLQGIYSTIVLKDVIDRQKENGVSVNLNTLDNIVKFMSGNIGNLTSPNNIANTMTSSGNSVSTPTVDSYLRAFCESFILYRAGRFDIKGKKALQTLDKYYLVDMGFRYLLVGNKRDSDGYILENTVYLELLRRGYKVFVGKMTKKTNGEVKIIEVDFVAQKAGGITEYYQVAPTTLEASTFKREIASLEEIKDNYPKYLLSLDPGNNIHNGIHCQNVLEWLIS